MSTKRFASLMQGKNAAVANRKKKDFTVEEWYIYWRVEKSCLCSRSIKSTPV